LYVGFKAFEGGITAVHMLKSTVTLNKPIYVGQAILDISKTMMFNFWYGYIKPRYGDKAHLLYTKAPHKPSLLASWLELFKPSQAKPSINWLTAWRASLHQAKPHHWLGLKARASSQAFRVM
jgi:hypothetical protein